jgi:hypothetical protein
VVPALLAAFVVATLLPLDEPMVLYRQTVDVDDRRLVMDFEQPRIVRLLCHVFRL